MSMRSSMQNDFEFDRSPKANHTADRAKMNERTKISSCRKFVSHKISSDHKLFLIQMQCASVIAKSPKAITTITGSHTQKITKWTKVEPEKQEQLSNRIMRHTKERENDSLLFVPVNPTRKNSPCFSFYRKSFRKQILNGTRHHNKDNKQNVVKLSVCECVCMLIPHS